MKMFFKANAFSVRSTLTNLRNMERELAENVEEGSKNNIKQLTIDLTFQNGVR